MADLNSQISEARKQGYSDDDIVGYLGSSHPDLAPKIKEAQSQGYGASDIVGHLSAPANPQVPGNTPGERRQYLLSHPEARAANRAAIEREFGSWEAPTPEGGIGQRLVTGLISPITGPARELWQYVTDHDAWVKQHSGMGGASADVTSIPGASQAAQAASGDVAGAIGSTVGQAALTAAQIRAAGPRVIDEPGAPGPASIVDASKQAGAAAKNAAGAAVDFATHPATREVVGVVSPRLKHTLDLAARVKRAGKAAATAFANEESPAAAAPVAEPPVPAAVAIDPAWEQIAQSQGGKPYAKLTPREQTMVQDIAARLKKPAGPQLPAPAAAPAVEPAALSERQQIESQIQDLAQQKPTSERPGAIQQQIEGLQGRLREIVPELADADREALRAKLTHDVQWMSEMRTTIDPESHESAQWGLMIEKKKADLAALPAPPTPAASPAAPVGSVNGGSLAQQLRNSLMPESAGQGDQVATIAPVDEAAPAKDYAARPRAAKVGKLAQALHDSGISYDEAKGMEPEHWKMLADATGQKVPSDASMEMTLQELKRLDAAKAAPSTSKAAAKKDVTPPAARDTTRGEVPNVDVQTGSQPGGIAASPALPAAGEAGPGIAGAETRVRVPGQTQAYQARYQVRELDDVQPSHNGQSFAPNPKYKLQNDRDYSRSENQGKVVTWSTPAEFDPSFHITDNPDATNGPVVIDSEGHALGGNGRAMILQRVYESNPSGAQAYRDMLTRKAAQFGIDPEAVKGMQRPVLVREIADSEFGAAPAPAKQNAVTDFNKKGTAELRPAEKAIADSRRVSTETLDHLASRLEAAGPDATLNDVLDGRGGVAVFNRMVDDGVISPQERAAYVNGGDLTAEGKSRISRLMLGRFFRDPAQLDRIAPSVRNKLERIAAPLAKVEGKAGWNILPDVQSALDLIEGAQSHGTKNLSDFVRQSGLFGEQQFSPRAMEFAKLLQKATPSELTKAVRQYASDSSYANEPNMFGVSATPEDSFLAAFGDSMARPADLKPR